MEEVWSIIWLFIRCLAFPLKVVCVALLSVVSCLWIENVISHSHLLTVGNSCGQCRELHTVLCEWVCGCRCPKHDWAFVGGVWTEIKAPILSYVLVHRVAMNMLSLREWDASYSVSVILGVPDIWEKKSWLTCSFIKFSSFVEAYFIRVLVAW